MHSLWEIIGKAHPVVLHFPISLLVVSGGVEVLRWFRNTEFLGRLELCLLILGAALGVAAALSGWSLAQHENIRSDHQTALTWHRWLGVAAPLIAATACVLLRLPSRAAVATGRATVLIAAVAVLSAGYFGGELVWGADWFAPSATHSHE